MKSNHVRAGFLIGPDQLEALRALSRRSGVPICVILRRSVDLFLASHDAAATVGLTPRLDLSAPCAQAPDEPMQGAQDGDHRP